MPGTKVQRRHFMLGAAAATVVAPEFVSTTVFGKTIKHKPLDPVNPDILFGTTSSIWNDAGLATSSPYTPEEAIKVIAARGLQGIEFYGHGIEGYINRPMALKKLFDDAGITFIDASNGEKGQSTNFIDPDRIPKTIEDHVAFCRDFLQPLGCDHFKINMGARPPGGPSEEQLKRLADTLNVLGEKTIKMGIRLSPHPHIWGPLEREKDMRWVMDHTDPKYVWLCADTGHLELGGGDAVQIISDYFPRVSEIHLKDTYAKYRGNTETPTQEQHKVASVYHNLGGGGVDFVGVFKVLRDRHFKGWAVFDVDGPRKGDDGYDAIGGNDKLKVDDYLSHNINYLRDVLGIRLPPQP
ncbi:MAG TPA: sugar phosphate isomerase/epimerase [Rhizomicrobium sp.]|nr:sugar phosphate isomerase/epimerase [Rhizomicrobium sp.]